MLTIEPFHAPAARGTTLTVHGHNLMGLEGVKAKVGGQDRPGGTVHTTAFPETFCVSRHARPPIETSSSTFSGPKFWPVMVTLEPPDVWPCAGSTPSMAGGS